MGLQARRTFLDRYRADVGAKDMLRSIYLILTARKFAESEQALQPDALPPRP